MNMTMESDYNISIYPCIQLLDGLSTSIETCTTSSANLEVNCATQHWIYSDSKGGEYTNNVSTMLLDKTPSYSNNMIHFTFVYNISAPTFYNSSFLRIPTKILADYRHYLTPAVNKTHFNKYNETMTQITLYFGDSEYIGGNLWYQLSVTCELFLKFQIVPAGIESYLAGLLTSNDGKQVFLYFDTNIQGYVCLDAATYDESMNPLKLTLYYKHNINSTQQNSSNPDPISFSLEYGYDYARVGDVSKFYFCQSQYIKGLMFEEYRTVELTMMSKSDYFTSNNNLYDVNIINISDSQTLLCFVISTVLGSIILMIALKKTLNLSNTTDKNIWNICLSWLIFLDYFIISCYSLYVYLLYTGNTDECGEYHYRNATGRLLDRTYQFMIPLSFILPSQLFELRIILFKQNEKKDGTACTSGICLEKYYSELNIGEKWSKYNIDTVSLDVFACVSLIHLGKEVIESIDDYNQCESKKYTHGTWGDINEYCEGEKGDTVATVCITCLVLCVFIWIHWSIMNTRIWLEITGNQSKLQFFLMLVLFCICFVVGGTIFYLANVDDVLDYTIYKTMYYTVVVIGVVSFFIHAIKGILLMIGCMPRSIYMMIGLFVVVSNNYLNPLVTNAPNAPYAPFIIILTPIAMIALVWSLGDYLKEFKNGIIVIQSIFLQLLGMFNLFSVSSCNAET